MKYLKEINKTEYILSKTEEIILGEVIKILNLFQVETEYFSKEKQTTISKIWPRLSALTLSLKDIESENHIFQEMKALIYD